MARSRRMLSEAASQLHGYLLKEHWNGKAVVGPDSGVRFNARIGRFIKSYLDFLPWRDDYIYLQGQGYWILSNWVMADLVSNERCKEIALTCSRYVLATQRPEGYWEYPNPEWAGRIATLEGNFATLGLLESYCRTREESLLLGAQNWARFLVDRVGWQGHGGLFAVNYFANVTGALVPNNTTVTLWVLAKLAEATNDDRYLTPCGGMVAWLRHVQLATGELPYAVGTTQRKGRCHYLCYQYNAFEFLDLAQYYGTTRDPEVWPVLAKLAVFLSKGLCDSGAARHDCHRDEPEVPYYTAAMAAALSQATAMGLASHRSLADRAYARLLSQQGPDGGIEFFSRGDYGLLTDRRSYPRNLSMILYHLLQGLQLRANRSSDRWSNADAGHEETRQS